jgi:trehalose-phosphatase
MRTIGATAQHQSNSGGQAAGVPHLSDRWSEVSRRVRDAKDIRLFVDFDGTLAQHSAHPESVKLSNEMKAVLRRIVKHPHVHVIIISGRRRATLQRLVRIPNIEFYGLYGSENGNGLDIPRPAALKLREIIDTLEENSPQLHGIHVEDKGLSVAIHFRHASPDSSRKARQLIRRIVSAAKSVLRVVETGDAWDVVPNHVQGKGVAIRHLLGHVRHDFLPIYVGDDISDEPALAELRHGITIRVAPAHRTQARYRLDDSEEVCEFLDQLEKELP